MSRSNNNQFAFSGNIYGAPSNVDNNKPVNVGKIRHKGRKHALTSTTLLENYALEEKNAKNVQKKLNGAMQQKPAFKLLDQTNKKTEKLNKSGTDEEKLNEFFGSVNSNNAVSTNFTARDDKSDVSYNFNANHHLDKILNNQQPTKASIKPPTVKLTSIEMGVIPESANPFVPSRRDLNRKLTKLAHEKQKDISFIEKKKLTLRVVGDMAWEDNNLLDFDPNDFRMFVGDLGHEVTDKMLSSAFNHYPSVSRVRVIRHPRAKKNKGYGFVSFKDPNDYLKAMKEMNGKYIGVRPIKCKKSSWKDRSLHDVVSKKEELRKNGYKA